MRLGLIRGLCAAVGALASFPDAGAAGAMRIVVVIPDGTDRPLILERRLAEAFATGVREAGEARPEVVAIPANVHEAARRLRMRECDAVVVLGSGRPAALRDVASRTFAATLGRTFAYRPAYLLMAGGDAGREDRLGRIFPQVLHALEGVPARESAAEQ